ncbi:HNH endonuclease [Simiduia curdlanivorans]|uniref:HNH endonuclease n=1 Tax=Simiduia curdlanivorans TaxID=1492769 RepID=A0ABV8V466_9GAMM|nr:HNH endonuclease [Simiduia curdlanivorans]MDN3637363.1 HNH endonuclease [Simiduia curdlanivorans]
MFKVVRTGEPPECLANNQYNSPEIVQRLREMFHGKCYLCEQADLSAPEIEHFEPHEGDDGLKYEWNNLYFACSRCNSVKSNTHRNLLDCCSDEIDVVRTIKCLPPTMPDAPVQISAADHVEDLRVINTVELLHKCFNESNTAIRGITREVLVEKLFDYLIDLLTHRRTIVNRRTTPHEKQHAQERIEVMIQDNFEFSAFWRWYVLSDTVLRERLSDAINF